MTPKLIISLGAWLKLPALLARADPPVVPSRLERKPRKRHHLPVVVVRQHYSYSCCPAVFQTLHHFLTGEMVSHHRAIRLTRCTRAEGALFEDVVAALCRVSKARARSLKGVAAVKAALIAGQPVIACDNATYADPHAVLLIGATRKGVYVMDPNKAEISWRRTEWLCAALGEFIAVVPTKRNHWLKEK